MISTLRLAVLPSPRSNDHAVRCLVDGEDIVEQLGGLGLDPDDFFSSRRPVAVAAEPERETRIGRCRGCGVVGCDDVSIRVARQQDQVVWKVGGREIRFDGAQYDAELARAALDHTWETPQRAAERLLRDRLPTELLRARGLAFEWASGRAKLGRFTMALHPTSGRYRQILLDVPWVDDLEEVIAEALALLRRHADGTP